MHRKNAAFLILVLSSTLVISSVATAQTPTRIKFTRGARGANVTGTLNSFRSRRTYVIRIREGQTLRTVQIGGGRRPITILVKDANGDEVGDSDASCNNRLEISPTLAGDYTIEVTECQKADPWRGRFTFRVAVR